MATGNKGGRPTKLTTAAMDRAVHAARIGAPFRLVAAFAGVGLSTLNDHLRNGRANPATPDGEFYVRYREALAQAEVGLLALWYNAARVDWRAAANLLAVRRPDDYAKHTLLDIDRSKAKGSQRSFELTLKVVRAAVQAEPSDGE